MSAANATTVSTATLQPPRLSSRHIRSLDGFRGMAFLLVFMRHYVISSHLSSKTMRVVEAVGVSGWMGVDLFFTLSGFLITGILLDTRDDPHYFRNFYVRRALRIFPLYYGLFLVFFVLTPLLHLQWRPGHLAYLLYAGNIAYNLDPTLALVRPSLTLLHFWSLAIEEQFYFVWPLVILFISNRRTLVRVCFGLSAVSLLLRCGLVYWSLPRGAEWAYAQLPTHMDGLLAGAIIAVWFRAVPLQTLVARARWVLPAAGVVLAVIIGVAGHFDFISYGMTTLGFPVLAFFFASVLLIALEPGTWANWIGSTGFLRFFGKYSYGMYIFHYVFSLTTGQYLAKLQGSLHSVMLGGLVYVGLVFAGTIVISVASYNLHEKRWLGLKSKFSYSTSNG